MQGGVKVLAGDVVSDGLFVRMNRVGFRAQRRFCIEEFGYGIERRHGNPPTGTPDLSIKLSRAEFNQSGKRFKHPVKGLDLVARQIRPDMMVSCITPIQEASMSLSMSTVATQSFLQTLTALSKILDKAAAHCVAKKIDEAVLLQMRLFPDMFPFVKQVQLVCDFAKNTMGRLTGEPPKFPDEEKSLADLKARIAKTIDYVKGFSAADIDGTAEKDVTFPVGPQNTMTLKGAQYVIGFALPNFYFHATTAYDILRQCGVEIGKRDFLGRT
jgi:uncharacterized protein